MHVLACVHEVTAGKGWCPIDNRLVGSLDNAHIRLRVGVKGTRAVLVGKVPGSFCPWTEPDEMAWTESPYVIPDSFCVTAQSLRESVPRLGRFLKRDVIQVTQEDYAILEGRRSVRANNLLHMGKELVR